MKLVGEKSISSFFWAAYETKVRQFFSVVRFNLFGDFLFILLFRLFVFLFWGNGIHFSWFSTEAKFQIQKGKPAPKEKGG